MKIQIKYDKKADSIYLYFSVDKVAFSKELDRERRVDYSEDGEIRGIKFLSASSGLKTDDLPHRSAIERALNEKGIAILTHKQVGYRLAGDLYVAAGNSGAFPAKAQVKARLKILMWSSLAILILIGLIVADVLLSRNMFILDSLTGLTASLFGLVVVMFPTVAGCFILLAWVFDTYSQTSRL